MQDVQQQSVDEATDRRGPAGSVQEQEVEKAADTVDLPGDTIATKIPSSAWLAGTLGTVAASVGLYLKGKRDASLFVGLWAPTILQFGIYNKMLRISRGTARVTE